eukprot:TRINITY_DN6380_c0_g1_i4.p1 TRINITY_DN6380_c0_g1~~TRINITY_DN6380_c0_g1_i4.p1  ORF type:complete len:250 (-),score=58.55 TRINITY_DN6380_c0_g1_i4:138-887(-)
MVTSIMDILGHDDLPGIFARSQEFVLLPAFYETVKEEQILYCYVSIVNVSNSSLKILVVMKDKAQKVVGYHIITSVVVTADGGQKFDIPQSSFLRKVVRSDLLGAYFFPKVKSSPPKRGPDYVHSQIALRPSDLDIYLHVNSMVHFVLAIDALDMAVQQGGCWPSVKQQWFDGRPAPSFHAVPWRQAVILFDGQLKLTDKDVQVAVWMLDDQSGFICVTTKLSSNGNRAPVFRAVLALPQRQVKGRSSM